MNIPIESARPGMQVDHDILLPSGSVLVNGPCELTDKIIAILKKNGIGFIQVAGDDSQAGSLIAEEVIDENPLEGLPDDLVKELTQSDGERVLPEISVVISNDAMSAGIRIIPTGAENEDLEISDLTDALKQAGVSFGIVDGKLSQAVDTWKKMRKPCVVENVACGQAAIAGRNGSWEMVVRHLVDAVRCKEVRNFTHCWQLSDLKVDFDPITKGMAIARRLPPSPPVPGTTVTGEPVSAREVDEAAISLDASVELSQDGREVLSRHTGAAFRVDTTMGVIALDLNGSAQLFMSPDRMKVDIMVHPAAAGGRLPDMQQIREMIAQAGIVHGIDTAVLDDLAKQLASGHCPNAALTFALGTPARDGKNGIVVYHFPTETSLKPKHNPDGSVDFKNVDIVHSVKKGDILAVVEPPGEFISRTNAFMSPSFSAIRSWETTSWTMLARSPRRLLLGATEINPLTGITRTFPRSLPSMVNSLSGSFESSPMLILIPPHPPARKAVATSKSMEK